jgi:hypothetical protein
VVLAEQGIGKREKGFHDTFFAQVCDDVVVTGCEEWDIIDRERFRRRFASVLDHRLRRFHFVSGLRGMEARKATDAAGLEAAGITLLESRIRELSQPMGRTSAIQEGLCQLADDLSYWLGSIRNERGDRFKVWWRPDSWSRWSVCMPQSAIKHRLSAQLGATS